MKKLTIASILSITFLLLISFFSCTSMSSTQETKEIPYVTINTVVDGLNANFDELTDLYGMGESSGDNEIPKIPEIDITGVTACDDGQKIRFDGIIIKSRTGPMPLLLRKILGNHTFRDLTNNTCS